MCVSHWRELTSFLVGRTTRKTVALLYLLLVAVFQRSVCGTDGSSYKKYRFATFLHCMRTFITHYIIYLSLPFCITSSPLTTYTVITHYIIYLSLPFCITSSPLTTYTVITHYIIYLSLPFCITSSPLTTYNSYTVITHYIIYVSLPLNFALHHHLH